MNELTRTNLIVNPTQTTPSLQCPICLDLVIEPYECQQCGKIFCKDCITNWLNNSPEKECPLKHKFIRKLILDDWITQTLQKIYIECPYKTCYSQYAYSAWPTHVKVCIARTKGIRVETPTGEEVFVDKSLAYLKSFKNVVTIGKYNYYPMEDVPMLNNWKKILKKNKLSH